MIDTTGSLYRIWVKGGWPTWSAMRRAYSRHISQAFIEHYIATETQGWRYWPTSAVNSLKDKLFMEFKNSMHEAGVVSDERVE